MNKLVLALALGGFAFSLHAEEKTCAVKGMHCQGCTEMVQGKVCEDGKYSTCDVKITDEKKEMGEIHLITKDEGAKIDEKSVDAAVKDAGYKMQKCRAGAAKVETKEAKG